MNTIKVGVIKPNKKLYKIIFLSMIIFYIKKYKFFYKIHQCYF
jgi:hypothetical protein